MWYTEDVQGCLLTTWRISYPSSPVPQKWKEGHREHKFLSIKKLGWDPENVLIPRSEEAEETFHKVSRSNKKPTARLALPIPGIFSIYYDKNSNKYLSICAQQREGERKEATNKLFKAA